MEFILDIHCHTVASGHAYSTLNENAAWAKQIGLSLTGVADHGPEMPGSCQLYYFGNLRVLPEIICGVRVLKGAEVNIMDDNGTLDIPDDLLKRLDFVIASLHSVCIEPGDEAFNTQAVIHAMENPYVHILGHPGDPSYPINEAAVVKAAKEARAIIEINNASLVPGSHRYGGSEPILRLLSLCQMMRVPVLASSDAHVDKQVGNLALAKQVIEASGIDEKLVLNTDEKRLWEALEKKKG